VKLHDDEPDSLESMLRFFYGFPLYPPLSREDEPLSEEEAWKRLERIVKVYVAADKYDAEGLRSHIMEGFNSIAPSLWKQPDFFAGGHLELCLRTIYDNLPDPDLLRHNAARRTATHLSEYHERDAVLLREMLERLPELAKDIVLYFARDESQSLPMRLPSAPHKTALHWAAHCGDVEECRKLLDAGIGVDVRDDEGETPLHFAAFYGQLDATRLLISKGADVNTASHTYPQGTPHRWATSQGHAEIVRVLEEAGARDQL
jgi:hypothetical protein